MLELYVPVSRLLETPVNGMKDSPSAAQKMSFASMVTLRIQVRDLTPMCEK